MGEKIGITRFVGWEKGDLVGSLQNRTGGGGGGVEKDQVWGFLFKKKKERRR